MRSEKQPELPTSGQSAFDRHDIVAGILFIAIGAAFLVGGWSYAFGATLNMGPGFFPRLLSIALLGLGGMIALRGFVRRVESTDDEFAWGVVVRVIGAVALFAVLLRGAGLYIALPAALLLAATASARFRPWEAGALAIFLTVCCDLIFRRALGMPIPALGSWF